MKNKEISPLDALKSLRCAVSLGLGSQYEKMNNKCDIIESALKREDSIEITAIDIEQDNKTLCKENKKLKRVLEIIKEKDVNVALLKGILHTDKSLHTASYYNSYFVTTYRHLTQKEFNLLKEVLK